MSIALLLSLIGTGMLLGRILHFQRWAFWGMACVGGMATFMVLANALGYVFPIDVAFWITAIVHIVAGIAGFWLLLRREREVMDRPTIVLGIAAAVCAFAVIRTLGSDPWFWAQYPLAATIAEGNLGPVREVGYPDHVAAYHYGPQLLAGAWFALAELPLEFGFALQAILGVFGCLFFAAELARMSGMRSWRSIVLAVLALAGGGVLWLHGGLVVSDILRDDVSPFRSIVFLFRSNVTNALLPMFEQRTTALGYPLLFGLALAFAASLRESKSRFAVFCMTGAVLGAALALTMETGLLLFGLAAGLWGVLLHLRRATRRDGIHVLLACVCMLLPALFIALVQGGVLSHLGAENDAGALSVDPSFGVPIGRDGTRLALWSPTVLIAFGLPILLLPWTAWVARKETGSPLQLVAILTIVHLLFPFVVSFDERPSEMVRLLYGATSFGAFLAGWRFLMKPQRWAYLGIGAMVLSSIVYVSVRLTLPRLRAEIPPLIERLPASTVAEHELYAWIREHTTIADRFYVRSQELGPEFLEEDLQDIILFMTRTGRFAVADYHVDTFPEEKIPLLRSIEERCDGDAFRSLGIRYLVVLNDERAAWFASTCDRTQWDALSSRLYHLID